MKLLISIPFILSYLTSQCLAIENEIFNWKKQLINNKQIDNLIQFTFQANKHLVKNKSHLSTTSNALLLIQDESIIVEKYTNGFDQDSPQKIWSISKSIAGTLIGARISENQLSVNDRVSQYYAQLNNLFQKDITIRDLLQMSSGIYWNEYYESNPFDSSVVKMLYGEGSNDMATFTTNQKQNFFPGTYFNYSSGETNLLLGVLAKSFSNQSEYENYPWTKLFNPLGISSATWERDLKKTLIGSSYLYLSARDLARIARLYLQLGNWQGLQIIDKNYILDAMTAAPASCSTEAISSIKGVSYGYHWWLNKKCPQKSQSLYPALPEDMLLGLGHHGQTLAIFPKLNAIAIRLGADKKGRFDRGEWLKKTHAIFKENQILQKNENL